MAKSTKKANNATQPGSGTTKVAKSKAAAEKGTTARSGSSKAPAGKGGAATAVAPSPYDEAFLVSQRLALLAERARYLKSADALKAEADALVNEREPGDVQFDDESGEGDSLAVERERDLALSAQARAAVELIDAALSRLDAGTYGICVHSGQPIPQERLEAIPWASERVEFKTGSFRS